MRLFPWRLRPKRPRRDLSELTEQERLLKHIWTRLQVASHPAPPPKFGRQDVIVLQMGKVASTSICAALHENGFNAFHLHSFSIAAQQGLLTNLLTAVPTIANVNRLHRPLVSALALSLLHNWYKVNKRRNGAKLRVVTLARDPVNWFRSSFMQRWQDERPRLRAWAAAQGLPTRDDADDAAAARAMVAALVPIIVEAAPSRDEDEALEIGRRRLMESAVRQPFLHDQFRRCLIPLRWFDQEILDPFGLDVLAVPELRSQGHAMLELDHLSLLAIRFEDLTRCLPQLARFVGIESLTLPRENITAERDAARAVDTALRAALDDPATASLARELRHSRYGRAWGYDAPRSTPA